MGTLGLARSVRTIDAWGARARFHTGVWGFGSIAVAIVASASAVVAVADGESKVFGFVVFILAPLTVLLIGVPLLSAHVALRRDDGRRKALREAGTRSLEAHHLLYGQGRVPPERYAAFLEAHNAAWGGNHPHDQDERTGRVVAALGRTWAIAGTLLVLTGLGYVVGAFYVAGSEGDWGPQERAALVGGIIMTTLFAPAAVGGVGFWIAGRKRRLAAVRLRIEAEERCMTLAREVLEEAHRAPAVLVEPRRRTSAQGARRA